VAGSVAHFLCVSRREATVAAAQLKRAKQKAQRIKVDLDL
jgi:hypothetical protein